MKKFIIAVTLFIMSVTCFSQTTQEVYARELANQFALECSAITTNAERTTNDVFIIQMVLPSYFDSELLVTYANMIMKSYGDIEVYKSWEKSAAHIHATYTTLDDYMILISYNYSLNMLFISIGKL